jgi:hypothetical protein
MPTAAERTGDFSALTDPSTGLPAPLINEFTGQPFPPRDDRIPDRPTRPQSERLASRLSLARHRFRSSLVQSEPGNAHIRKLAEFFGVPADLFL